MTEPTRNRARDEEPPARTRPTGRGYRRPRCEGCGLTPELCLCSALPCVSSRTAIDVIVPWQEGKKPTNTARLLARMLRSCRILLRGGPTPEDGREVEAQLAELPAERALLLFPTAEAVRLEEVAQMRRGPLRLVVPDGTWSQAGRLARRHPALSQLERVRLDVAETSYALRRRREPGLLCTLEAVAAALDVLEPGNTGATLRAGFATWQARALAIRGRRPIDT